jgi:hypothetical protein
MEEPAPHFVEGSGLPSGPGKSLDNSELLLVLQNFPLTLAGLQVGRQKEGVERRG